MKLIILDRDGVINKDSDNFVKNADEWIPIDGSIDAIAKLFNAGFLITVATNQSGLGRKLFTEEALQRMHQKMQDLIKQAGGEVAGIFYCPHHPDDNCNCRKPRPGLIEDIEQSLNISAKGAFIIGDSLRDLQAGLTKGCIPILVKTGKGEQTLAKLNSAPIAELDQLLVFDNLQSASEYILKH